MHTWTCMCMRQTGSQSMMVIAVQYSHHQQLIKMKRQRFEGGHSFFFGHIKKWTPAYLTSSMTRCLTRETTPRPLLPRLSKIKKKVTQVEHDDGNWQRRQERPGSNSPLEKDNGSSPMYVRQEHNRNHQKSRRFATNHRGENDTRYIIPVKTLTVTKVYRHKSQGW